MLTDEVFSARLYLQLAELLSATDLFFFFLDVLPILLLGIELNCIHPFK